MSLNSVIFDFYQCDFTEKLMTLKDKCENTSREGSGRVALYKETGLPNCYTIECSYHSARRLNSLTSKLNKIKNVVEPENPLCDSSSKIFDGRVTLIRTLHLQLN